MPTTPCGMPRIEALAVGGLRRAHADRGASIVTSRPRSCSSMSQRTSLSSRCGVAAAGRRGEDGGAARAASESRDGRRVTGGLLQSFGQRLPERAQRGRGEGIAVGPAARAPRGALGRRLGRRGAAALQQLLDAADRIAVLVEQAVDAPGQRDVVGPVIAAVAGALQRPQLREARLPIAQDMLRDAEVAGEFADRPEGLSLLRIGSAMRGLSPVRAIRSRMIWLARKVSTRRGAIGTSTPVFGIAADPLALVAQDEAAEAGNLDVLPVGQRARTYGAGCARRCPPIRRATGRSRDGRCRQGRRGSTCPRSVS